MSDYSPQLTIQTIKPEKDGTKAMASPADVADPRRLQGNLGVQHQSTSQEQNAAGGGGGGSTNAGVQHSSQSREQDAGAAAAVATAPTTLPPSASPTPAPTSHPTLRGIQWLVRGSVWYDRNANGYRDADVVVDAVGDVRGRDVEWSHGLGGVRVRLVRCDPATGR